MTTLTVVTCTSAAGRRAVRRLDDLRPDLLPVDDIAIVDWHDDTDRPDAWQARPLRDADVLSGSFWGLLFAHLFLLPLTHRLDLGAQPSPESVSLDHLGLGPQQIERIRAMAGAPHTSTAFLLHPDDQDPADTAFAAMPHTSTTIRFTADERCRLYAGFGERAKKPPAVESPAAL